ncbi:unnamed protein product, partial [Ixodes persulcatus]
AEAQLLTALEGSHVQLACDITAPGPGDFPVRIRWFKDSGPNPVYSVEVNPKTGSLSQIRQSAQLTSLQGRAYFSVIQSPAVLSVDRLRYSDNGTYVCAVDFKKDWTRRLTTHLVLIVPCKSAILDCEFSSCVAMITQHVLKGKIHLLVRRCRGGTLKTAETPVPSCLFTATTVVLSKHLCPRTSPGFLIWRISCVCSSSRYYWRVPCVYARRRTVVPVATNAVSLYMAALAASVPATHFPLSSLAAIGLARYHSNRPSCLSHRAPGPPLPSRARTRRYQDSLFPSAVGTSSSFLGVRARLCVGPMTTLAVLPEAFRMLFSIYNKPLVHLRLGSGLNPASIHEGIDIYFECSVRANPGVSEVTWRFNGRELHTDGSVGVIVSNQSLALRSVGRSNSGFYACSAANSEGESESSQLKLRVLHAPLCRSPKRQHSHAVAKHETVEVHCDMEADPSDVTFTWTFHQTHRNFQLAPNASSSTLGANHARSVLPYTPKVDSDYGTLYCLASNAVGDSVEPCIFQIIPVGPPATPFNCTVEEVTSEGVHVTCQRSGPAQQQTFLLELHDGQSPPIATNFTSGQASFRVHSLRPATRYRVVLYGVNANGRSEPVHMTVVTLPLEQTLASQGENAEAAWALGSTTLWAAVLSAAAAFLIVFIALTLGKFRRKVLFNRARRMWNGNEREPQHLHHDLVQGSTDIGTELAAFDPPAMITFKDPMMMKPRMNGSSPAIVTSIHPKVHIPA